MSTLAHDTREVSTVPAADLTSICGVLPGPVAQFERLVAALPEAVSAALMTAMPTTCSAEAVRSITAELASRLRPAQITLN
ncbi:hypothetical protein [Streptomyces sp. NPDC057403]|uniref:hypothetical protein n=1 Tax=Streptomyces sp. NPDC057403 TaxID=3346119 RepID=UPI0036CAF9CA